MVMNHYKQTKRFYVRTRIWYTTEPRTPLYPVSIGDCRHLGNGMSYDVPGGGKPGSEFVDRSRWTAPFGARILGGASHHHGGATHQTLSSVTCGRTLMDAKAYYGAPDHPYNTIRPILHEPGPIANGTFQHRSRASRSRRGRRSSASPITPTSSCTWPRWASGCCSSCATTR